MLRLFRRHLCSKYPCDDALLQSGSPKKPIKPNFKKNLQIGGTGLGLMYVPAVVSVGENFYLYHTRYPYNS